MTATDQVDALYHPLNLDHTGNPERRLAEARATCPVSTPSPRLHVVATNELVREVLMSPDGYANRGNFSLTPDPPVLDDIQITSMDGTQHAEFRQFMRQWFAPIQLRKQEGRIEQIVSSIFATLEPGQQIDFLVEVARKVPAWTVYAFVGLPQEDWAEIQRWTDTIHDHLPNIPPDMPEVTVLFDYLHTYLAARIAVGEAQQHDLIDGLVFADGMTLSAAAGHVFQVLNAGTATTMSLISNLVYELLHDRSNWERLVADPSLVNTAVEESLRRDAPLQYAIRTVTEDAELGGCPVNAGDRLVISLQSANWDESVWGPDAETFDLDRGATEASMSFGYGIHTCLGAPLARLEAQVLLRRLVHAFPDLRLADGFTRTAAHDPMLRRPATLEVVL